MIRLLIFYLFLCAQIFFAHAVLAEEDFLFRWSVNKSVNYDMIEDSINVDYGFSTNVDELLGSSSLRESMLKRLQSIELPNAFFNMAITPPSSHDGFYRAKAKYIVPAYRRPPLDEHEKSKRQFIALQEQGDKFVVDFNSRGENQFFFLEQEQKNLSNIFFLMPQERVSVGDSWSIPIHLIALESNTVVDMHNESSHIFFQGVKEEKGRRIARLVYIIHSEIEGNTHLAADWKFKQKIKNIILGYGEFYIDDGFWKHITLHGAFGSEDNGYTFKVWDLRLAK